MTPWSFASPRRCVLFSLLYHYANVTNKRETLLFEMKMSQVEHGKEDFRWSCICKV